MATKVHDVTNKWVLACASPCLIDLSNYNVSVRIHVADTAAAPAENTNSYHLLNNTRTSLAIAKEGHVYAKQHLADEVAPQIITT